MAISDMDIEELRIAACDSGPLHFSAAMRFARAIEAEVRKDYDALIRQMLEHLEVVNDAGPDVEGWQSQDLKNTIAAATARLEKAP